MDDVFANNDISGLLGQRSSSKSKIYMNRIFEKNPVPTIWTINDIGQLDETIIRRMSLALEIKVPSEASRKVIWGKVMKKYDVSLSGEELDYFSKFDISPAVVDNAIRFAKHAGGQVDDLRFATNGIVKAIKGKQLPVMTEKVQKFLPELVNAEISLDTLTNRLSASKYKNFSLCLYGPPGTGKSAYLRYLAEKLEMPVLFKRASDLLSKWVGGSEENIASAFSEAVEKGCFLIFDEADSLLGDRRSAQASWEITQTNEMLTWMETHPLPFACTTNLKEHLDPASLRRFVFKSYFDYLRPEQIQHAFQSFFGYQLPQVDTTTLSFLTPGDFAVVLKKANLLGIEGDGQAVVDLLLEEIACKDISSKTQIGFRS